MMLLIKFIARLCSFLSFGEAGSVGCGWSRAFVLIASRSWGWIVVCHPLIAKTHDLFRKFTGKDRHWMFHQWRWMKERETRSFPRLWAQFVLLWKLTGRLTHQPSWCLRRNSIHNSNYGNGSKNPVPANILCHTALSSGTKRLEDWSSMLTAFSRTPESKTVIRFAPRFTSIESLAMTACLHARQAALSQIPVAVTASSSCVDRGGAGISGSLALLNLRHLNGASVSLWSPAWWRTNLIHSDILIQWPMSAAFTCKGEECLLQWTFELSCEKMDCTHELEQQRQALQKYRISRLGTEVVIVHQDNMLPEWSLPEWVYLHLWFCKGCHNGDVLICGEDGFVLWWDRKVFQLNYAPATSNPHQTTRTLSAALFQFKFDSYRCRWAPESIWMLRRCAICRMQSQHGLGSQGLTSQSRFP